MPPWQPKASIDEKSKTGDIEHLRMLAAACQTILDGASILDQASRNDRHERSDDETLTALSEGLQKLAKKDLTTDQKRSNAFGRVLMDPALALEDLSAFESLREAHARVGELATTLGRALHPFLVNLALFDFRTASGGRNRKSTDALRLGAESYTRPFRDPLPIHAELMLTAIKNRRTPDTTKAGALAMRASALYLPPTRFTATFPLLLTNTNGTPDVLEDPQVPGAPSSGTGKYAFIGSFGFAERSYSTWNPAPDHETPGTRLSVGAYSLDPASLTHILGLWEKLSTEDKTLYAQYGSVGIAHLKLLQAKLGGGKGLSLAIRWVVALAHIARALVEKAKSVCDTSARDIGRRRFLDFVLTRIDTREAKLAQLEKTATPSDANLFDYIWVFEASLWELAFLAASQLSMTDILAAVQRVLPDYKATVSTSETDLGETIRVGQTNVARVYFPSGSHAADKLFEHLVVKGFEPSWLKADKSALSTFTPYFEFYQMSSAFLNEGQKGKLVAQLFTAVQMWLNLSDGVHAAILDRIVGTACTSDVVAELIATLTAEHVTKRLASGEADVCLVIDFTKFGGDMPNERLYPILVELDVRLRAKLTRVKSVVYLRSNLKYNTGSLDRYQSGEILLPRDDAPIFAAALPALTQASKGSFQRPPNASDWTLCGEYVPLMKRTYLLADAIGFGRFITYTDVWGGVPLASSGAVAIESDASGDVRVALAFIASLEPIYSHLLESTTKKSFKAFVSADVRSLITRVWKQVQDAKEVLGQKPGAKERRHVARILHGLATDLAVDLTTILDALKKATHASKGTPVASDLHRYASSLGNLRIRHTKEVAPLAATNPDLDAPTKIVAKTMSLPKEPVSVIGKACGVCSEVHGRFPSVFRRWHACTTCLRVFCWGCGFKLAYYRFQDLDEVIDAMDRDYTNPNVRACATCGGQTALV